MRLGKKKILALLCLLRRRRKRKRHSMETVSSNGRTETNTAAGDVLAVCANCNRLSSNLKSCDKCGGALSDDSGAPDPKRSRLSDPSEVSFTSSAQTTKTTPPVASTTEEVRPQALFLNVNNQILPVLGISMSGTTAAGTVPSNPVVVTGVSNSTPVATSRPAKQTTTAVPVGLVYNGTATTTVQPQIRPAPAVSRSSAHVTLPSYNLQPPPPPFSSNIARLPVVVSSAASIPPVITPNSQTSSTQNCQISAVEIRIGSRKFKPISPVTFKDEGVLFMLKDFTYAPVLLNTRAIIKCRANLSVCGYPVLFLYLENSCMRQIRNIFGLSQQEFTSASQVELCRCISIFPVFGYDNRSQALSMAYSIKRTFDAMVRRYPRSTPILEEITNEVAIDILIDSSTVPDGAVDIAPRPTNGAVEVTRTNGQTAAATPITAAVSSQTSTNSSTSNTTGTTSTSAVSSRARADRSVSQQLLNGSTTSSHTNQTSGGSVTQQAGGSPQVLVIPQDAARWQALQKNLVVGGVYNVLVHTGQRKYCLWNGTQLVPCMVQNTEVQLNSSCIRVGGLITECVGQVRIRAEPSSGIFFTVKGEKCGQHEISITPDDILACEVCFSATSVMFITLSWAATEKLRQKLSMVPGENPQFDPAGLNMVNKYILLFLSDVNTDQEDAIKQLKFSQNQSQSAVQVIDLVVGISRLAQIKGDIRSTAEAYDYLNKEKLQGQSGFEKLVLDLCKSSSVMNGADDDDDDVIMTQEEVGIKCPYTQQIMKDPVRNKICGHNYEKLAILEFIVRKKGTARCPYAGCSQTVPLKTEDIQENVALKEYIKKLHPDLFVDLP